MTSPWPNDRTCIVMIHTDTSSYHYLESSKPRKSLDWHIFAAIGQFSAVD